MNHAPSYRRSIMPALALIGALIVPCALLLGQAQRKRPEAHTTVEAAGPDFPVQGEFEGSITDKGKLGAQIVALGDGKFDVYFLTSGLPGAGWDTKGRTKCEARREAERVTVSGSGWSGEIRGASFTGKTPDGDRFRLEHVVRHSPSLGAKPPIGAIVLFDGKNADEWTGGKVVENNLLDRGTRSKRVFGPGKLHIEFRTPFMPTARGQGRGNSGVFILGREIQVLDSFGLTGDKNECGALYDRAKPAVNMCLPPLSWQTYDIEIGPGAEPDTFLVTVLHNGVKVHDQFALTSVRPAPIQLQNHGGDPVVFRNIWFVEGEVPKQAGPIPHNQDAMPGPPLSAQQAIARMTVPDGFTVELVAGEPDIVNPVAMTFDERGRIWITESLEYPRKSAGAGRDRIKVLESTKGDGKYDKITVFADGLNIPSGIAVGQGGVWVANAPDILFLQDTRGTGRCDKREVVATGFGRDDTHELPNSLTWGPDGWLYGLNGVFNHSHVRQGEKDFRFTCAMFRVHPRTREFQLFCEGTSNPWGIAFDAEGSAFVSACVIDHLWHLTETGYYHRQGGPYPPNTWILGSIVEHHHQKAAYCGLHYFDSDAYPPEYRDRLYMGNIHGGCINVDVLQRNGSTYAATAAPDFLVAHDPWFMPVAQKTGPDGCLYILDWYDRYHCYQDANRDPEGIDRLRGRLYRVRYKNTPAAGKFDLARETDEQLVERLKSPNIYFRDTAQRILRERNTPALRTRLQQFALSAQVSRKARMHALWALVGGGPLESDFALRLLAHDDPGLRAWAVRAAGNARTVDEPIRRRLADLAHDPSPDVKLQVAIASRKVEGTEPIPVLVEVLRTCGDDKLIPGIVWQNLNPLLDAGVSDFFGALKQSNLGQSPAFARVVPRVLDRIVGNREFAVDQVAELLRLVTRGRGADADTARQCLALLTHKVQTGEIAGERIADLRRALEPAFPTTTTDNVLVQQEVVFLLASMKHPNALAAAVQLQSARDLPETTRLKALEALIAGGNASIAEFVRPLLSDPKSSSVSFRAGVLAALGRYRGPGVADAVLDAYPRLEPELQPRAIELLTQRPEWAKPLLRAIGDHKLPAAALNVNQVRKLLASKDPTLVKDVEATWGTIRDGRNAEREQIVADMKKLLRKSKGDPAAGMQVFHKVCAQCHKIYGAGQDVGPDITSNGRGDFDQLLSNVFDPSLVIGVAYQATTVVTTQGRLLVGILVEDNMERVVLRVQGGKLETIPRAEVEEFAVSKVSLMPEGLEKQLQPSEIVDLFAFLTLDRPPGDPQARPIPGTPR